MTLIRNMTPDLALSAKWAFTTRRVTRDDMRGLRSDVTRARPGDLVLGRVARIGSHKNIQLASGRPSELYEGDLVVLCCGARYAPDQFEGVAEIGAQSADMLAGGGVLGRMRVRHAAKSAPTEIAPLGLLARRDGAVMNIADYAMTPAPRPGGIAVVGVLGASMNSGKTTAAASLVHGLRRAGLAPAAIKATGTGAFGDYNAYLDAGALHVGDFVDAGMASTYLEAPARIMAGLDTQLAAARDAGCGVAVVELADGLLQRETAAIVGDPALRAAFGGFLFAAPDALSVAGGVAALAALGVRPLAISGLVTCSPLAMREAGAEAGAPLLTRDELRDPAIAGALIAGLTPGAAVADAA